MKCGNNTHLLTNMKTTFKILKYTLFFVVGFITIAVLWFGSWYLYEKGKDENVIIQDNYEGGIIVLCGEKTGSIEKYNTENERVYEIPQNGILKTKFKFQDGKRYDTKYFYKNGKELRYLWPSDKVWADTTNVKSIYKDSIYIYGYSYSNDFYFIVGKPKDIDKHFKELDRMWKPYSNPIILKTGEHYGKMPDKTYFDK